MTPLVKRYLRNEFDKQNVPGDTTITRVDAIRVRGVERREIARLHPYKSPFSLARQRKRDGC